MSPDFASGSRVAGRPCMTAASLPAAGPLLSPAPCGAATHARRAARALGRGGSEAAFAAIFERHHRALHRYCHTIVGNGHDASDALQSTMLKAFRALPGETREIALRPWLYRIAHNESISLLRARRPDRELEAAAHLGDPRAAGIVESRDRMRALGADLTELTGQQRGALLMRELGGLSFAEIAGALQISPAAAKQTVYESRCVLQALQEGREMDCDVVRRTLSDGDRRTLRGKRLRGHLRACAGCHDFEQALHARPAELAALAPPLPMGVAAIMLQGLVGGGGFGAGGGLVACVVSAAPRASSVPRWQRRSRPSRSSGRRSPAVPRSSSCPSRVARRRRRGVERDVCGAARGRAAAVGTARYDGGRRGGAARGGGRWFGLGRRGEAGGGAGRGGRRGDGGAQRRRR